MKAVALGAAIYADNPPHIARICPYGYAHVDDEEKETVVVPPGQEIPTPERSRYGLPMATDFLAQTIYRLVLVQFTERARWGTKALPRSPAVLRPRHAAN